MPLELVDRANVASGLHRGGLSKRVRSKSPPYGSASSGLRRVPVSPVRQPVSPPMHDFAEHADLKHRLKLKISV